MSAPNSPRVSGLDYLKTVRGISKIIEILLGITAGCLVGIGFVGFVIYIFEVAVAIGCLCALIYLILNLGGKNSPNKWQQEFANSIVSAVLYVIGSSLVFYYGGVFEQAVAGAAVGIVCAVVHLVDAADLFRNSS